MEAHPIRHSQSAIPIPTQGCAGCGRPHAPAWLEREVRICVNQGHCPCHLATLMHPAPTLEVQKKYCTARKILQTCSVHKPLFEARGAFRGDVPWSAGPTMRAPSGPRGALPRGPGAWGWGGLPTAPRDWHGACHGAVEPLSRGTSGEHGGTREAVGVDCLHRPARH
jgi:hypothetical protein